MAYPRKPLHLKLLCGSREPDRGPLVSVPEDRALTELPPAPDWLQKPLARDEWAKVGTELLQRGLLDAARLMQLGIYCGLSAAITKTLMAGDVPRSTLLRQHSALARQLGILGSATTPSEPPRTAGRLARIKQRAQEDNT